jgi:hypothetical protein
VGIRWTPSPPRWPSSPTAARRDRYPFFAGLSAREAAEVMGKQEGTVRGLQFRAIAALRRQLGIDRPAADDDDVAADRPRGR